MNAIDILNQRIVEFGYGMLFTDVSASKGETQDLDNKGKGYAPRSNAKIYEDTVNLRNEFFQEFGPFYENHSNPVDWTTDFWVKVPDSVLKNALKKHYTKLEVAKRSDGRYLLQAAYKPHREEAISKAHWSSTFDVQQKIFILRDKPYLESRIVLHRALALIEERKPFILFSEFTAEEIYRHKYTGAITKAAIEELCFFDLHKFVCQGDLYCFRYSDDPDMKDSIRLTPIEIRLKKALDENGFKYETQPSLGKFRPDFVVESKGRKIIVEADGVRYHVAALDQERDRRILKDHGLRTLRFGGSKILRSPDKCVEEISAALKDEKTNLSESAYEDFEQLDNSQKSAVKSDGGSILVVAPAGSGKTKVLINRVTELLNRNVEPSGILCLAFNRSAAQTMLQRLSDLAIETKGPRDEHTSAVTVATFNQFGLSILVKAGVNAELLANRELISVVNRSIKNSGVHLPHLRGESPWVGVMEGFSKVKAGLIAPEEVSVEFKTGNKTSDITEVGIADILLHFDKDCVVGQRVTFEDQIHQALVMMAGQFLLRSELQDRYSHIIVDEYQDLTPAQLSLVRIIAGKGQEVFVVGDDDQLIYGWNNVETDNFTIFSDSYPKRKAYPLRKNYRSSKSVVKHSQMLIKYNKNRIDKNVVADRKHLGDTRVIASEKLFGQLGSIVNIIKERVSLHKDELKEMAVLTRYNESLILVAYALDKAGIPRSSIPNVKLFSRPVSLVLLAYLEIIYDLQGAGVDDIKKTLNEPNRYLSNAFRDEIAQLSHPIQALTVLVRNGIDSDALDTQIVNDVKLLQSHLNENWRADNLRNYIEGLIDLSSLRNEKSPSEIIRALLNKFDFINREVKGSLGADTITDEIIVDVILEDSYSYSRLEDYLEYFRGNVAKELGDVGPSTNTEERSFE